MSEMRASEGTDRLREQLGRGTGAADTSEARRLLGLSEGADDAVLARALVRALSIRSAERVGVAGSRREDPRQSVEALPAASTPGASFLGRLSAVATNEGLQIQQLDDVRTLQAVLRAGSLFQRRAAARRLGERLREPKELHAERVRDLTATLEHLRDVEIAYELWAVRAQLPGSAGRRARADRKAWERLAVGLVDEVCAYWEEPRPEEPIAALHEDQRAQLIVRLRDVADPVVDHVAALVEQADMPEKPGFRRSLVASLQHAGDARLVPSLAVLLQGLELELMIPAARALARIEDPRVYPLLRAAHERCVQADQRVVLAGALGLHGDTRGADYVRQVLQEREAWLLVYALQALASLGSADDQRLVFELLEHDDVTVATAAVRTLARIGDARALAPLGRLHRRTTRSALWAEIEEAEAAVRARMELLGEEPPSEGAGLQAFDTASRAALVKRADPALVRLRASWELLLGYLWMWLAVERAVAHFEAAAAAREGWATPVVAIAMSYARHERYAQALPAFRRALVIDRAGVESQMPVVRVLARSFLRRAEDMEREGRTEIARGLLEEVLAYDLRKAPSGLRVAIHQRYEALREGGT